MSDYRINTKCVQGGYTPGNGEPRQIPIVQSTTFKYATSEDMGKLFDLEASGYFYTRLQNPTNDHVAAKICDMEGGTAAMLTSSGQAANFYAVFNIANCGDHVVASSTIYGGTYNLFHVTMRKMGIDFTFVSPDCTEEELNAAFKPNTKAVFGETIANPALTVLDIEKFAKAAHAHGVPLVIDNTFATPVNCRPFEWGCDIVTHSTTKYMDGHGAGVGGCSGSGGSFFSTSARSAARRSAISFSIWSADTLTSPGAPAGASWAGASTAACSGMFSGAGGSGADVSGAGASAGPVSNKLGWGFSSGLTFNFSSAIRYLLF